MVVKLLMLVQQAFFNRIVLHSNGDFRCSSGEISKLGSDNTLLRHDGQMRSWGRACYKFSCFTINQIYYIVISSRFRSCLLGIKIKNPTYIGLEEDHHFMVAFLNLSIVFVSTTKGERYQPLSLKLSAFEIHQSPAIGQIIFLIGHLIRKY